MVPEAPFELPPRPNPSRVRALIAQAIALHGTQEALAGACSVTQNAIWQAKRKGQASAELAVAIDYATGGDVPRHELRPDLFETPWAVRPAEAIA